MRFLAILLIAMILLVGCAGNKVYNYKGIYYPEKEARELDALIKFSIPSATESKLTTHIPGELLITEEMLYYPVETSYPADSLEVKFTTIYAIDKSTNSIVDTLVLSNDNIRQDYKHLVWDKDLLIIGKNDSLCHIIKSDKDLNIIEDYPTGIRAAQIFYAGMNDGKLRLVVTDEMNNLIMYEFYPATMSLERKRLLLKDASEVKFTIDKQNLWFFQTGESMIKSIKIDISSLDPNAVIKDFSNPIRNAEQRKNYEPAVVDSIIYIQTNEFTPDEKNPNIGIYSGKLHVINYNDGKFISSAPFAPPYWDLAKADDKMYFYNNVMLKNKRTVFTVSETNAALQMGTKLVSFLPEEYKFISYRGMDSVPQIYADGNKIYATGYYYQNLDLSRKSKKVTVDWQPQLFLAVFSLK